MTANQVWRLMITDVFQGDIIFPRNLACRELLNYQSCVDMARPLITIPERKLSGRFACAEALWILQGSPLVGPLLAFAPGYLRFSDDGYSVDGAYGPKVVQQVRYVVETLQKDPDSRQAVMGIWRENPRESRDVPCTLSLQFLFRRQVLHCTASMRSSDCWLGWPYDVFSFTMIATYVALELRRQERHIELGELTINAGSQHIYESDHLKVVSIREPSLMVDQELSAHVLTSLSSSRHLLECLRLTRDADIGQHTDQFNSMPDMFKELYARNANMQKVQDKSPV